jgi:ribosomal protein S14
MYKRRKFFDYNKSLFQYSKNELNKISLKSLLSSRDFIFSYRLYFFLILEKYSKNSSISFFRRYCNISSYAKSVVRLFKMSRHCYKKYCSLGMGVGVRKSSF